MHSSRMQRSDRTMRCFPQKMGSKIFRQHTELVAGQHFEKFHTNADLMLNKLSGILSGFGKEP